mgnify:CR=1 FL=1
MDNMDGMTRAVEEKCGMKGLVGWFLSASLLYYHFDISILSDGRYDEIAKGLLEIYDTLENQHAPLILKEDLKAGSLYAMSLENYPLMIRVMCMSLMSGKLTQEQHARLNNNDFCPPEYAWDTYVYGKAAGTWRNYQKEMTAQWDDMIKKGQITVEQKREFSRKIGIKIAMAAPPPPAPPRVRQRPAEIQAQITRPRTRTIHAV